MSIPAQQSVWQRASALSNRALVVGLAIADHHNPDTGQCNPKIEVIAEKIGRGVTTVKRGIAELKDVGVIKVHRRKRTGSNFYSFEGCIELPKGHRLSPPRDTRVPPREGYPSVPSETKGGNQRETEQNSFGGAANPSGSCAEGKTGTSKDQAERRLLKNFTTYRCKEDAKTRLRLYMEAGRAFTDADHFHKPKNPAKPLSFSDIDDLRLWFEILPESGVEVLLWSMKNWGSLYDRMHPAVSKKVTRVPTMRNLMKYSSCAGSNAPVQELFDKYLDDRRERMLRQVEQHAPQLEDDYYSDDYGAALKAARNDGGEIAP